MPNPVDDFISISGFFCSSPIFPTGRNATLLKPPSHIWETSAVRCGIFVERQLARIQSSVGATSSLCRSHGAKSESKIGCCKYSAPDGAVKNKCVSAFFSEQTTRKKICKAGLRKGVIFAKDAFQDQQNRICQSPRESVNHLPFQTMVSK